MRESPAGSEASPDDVSAAPASPASADAPLGRLVTSRVPPAARFSRCSGISVIGCLQSPSLVYSQSSNGERDHNGPEFPPSLRTRQKWIAMKMTITNGKKQHVQHVPSKQRLGADLGAAEQHEPAPPGRTPG